MFSTDIPTMFLLPAGLFMLLIVLLVLLIRRGHRMTVLQTRILELEQEMMDNYAEILELQQWQNGEVCMKTRKMNA